MYIYSLQVCSTGETILTAETDRNMVSWQKRMEKKVIKNKNRAERFKEAIQALDTIVAWENFDLMQIEALDFPAVISYALNGYDKYFEERENERLTK